MSATLKGIGWTTNPAEYRDRALSAGQRAIDELINGVKTKQYDGGAATLMGGTNVPGTSIWDTTEGRLAANVLKQSLGLPDFMDRGYNGTTWSQDALDAVTKALGGDPMAGTPGGPGVSSGYVNKTLDPSKFTAAFNTWADANPDALNALYENSGAQAVQDRVDRHSESFAGNWGPKIVGALAAAGAAGYLPSFGPAGSTGINIGGQVIGNTAGNALNAAAGAAGAGSQAVPGNGNYLATAPKTAVTAQTNGATQAFTTTPFGGSVAVPGYTATGGATADMLNGSGTPPGSGTPGMEEMTVTAPRLTPPTIPAPPLADFQASLDELLSSMQAPTLDAGSGIDWQKVLSKVGEKITSMFGAGAGAAGAGAAAADTSGMAAPTMTASAAPASSGGTTLFGGTVDQELARLWGDQPGIASKLKPGSGVNALMQIQPRG